MKFFKRKSRRAYKKNCNNMTLAERKYKAM